MPNPYYAPEEMGLTVVGEIEYSDASWQFDTRVIWQDANGNLYTARDSGCSCPTPFEDYQSIDKLDRVNVDELRREIQNELNPGYSTTSQEQAQDLLRRVEEIIRNE